MINTNQKKAHHFPFKCMGCGFVLTAVHNDPNVAWTAMKAAKIELERIEELISSWKESSQTSQINHFSGKKYVSVDQELFSLIERSLKVSTLTLGSFDISGTLSRYYWNFNKKENPQLDNQKVDTLRSLIDYKNIILNHKDQSVFLAKSGMKIGFGGIGKGYAANMAKQVMMQYEIEDGLVNASGDLLCWGNPPQKNAWEINIPDPRDRNVNLLSVQLDQGSVVTSGSYENYTVIDGKRYSHIINPRTGYPVRHTKNVTVVCPDAELADALATSLSVLPINEGIQLINKLNGIECIIIDAEDQAHYSLNLKPMSYA